MENFPSYNSTAFALADDRSLALSEREYPLHSNANGNYYEDFGFGRCVLFFIHEFHSQEKREQIEDVEVTHVLGLRDDATMNHVVTYIPYFYDAETSQHITKLCNVARKLLQNTPNSEFDITPAPYQSINPHRLFFW